MLRSGLLRRVVSRRTQRQQAGLKRHELQFIIPAYAKASSSRSAVWSLGICRIWASGRNKGGDALQDAARVPYGPATALRSVPTVALSLVAASNLSLMLPLAAKR